MTPEIRSLTIMVNMSCVLLFVCVAIQTVCSQTGTSCRRPTGDVGNCVVFQDCDYYVNILTELGKDEAADIVRKSFCGYEGKRAKVCCPTPSCSLANNAKDEQTGPSCENTSTGASTCVVFQNCDYYVNTLTELGREKATNMLRKAHCGYEGKRSKVCCPREDCSSSTPAVNNTTGLPTTKSISRTGDFIPAFLDPPVCGRTKAVFNRVVGGEPANLDDFPWMALLGYDTRDGFKWWCGGSLISQRHVLTAGHCIYHRENILSVVRLGELDYARDDDGALPIDFRIKDMIVHEEYDPNFTTNDIGLLILQKDVTFTKSIHPICIPKGKWRHETFERYNPFIAGWGLTSRRGTPASHLQYLQLPVRKNKDCVEAFRSYKGRVFDQRVMCVGTLKGGKDSCDGDSGGPLMQPLTGAYYVTGVVSYGIQCAQPGFPSIYTRVTHFLPWIEKKVLGRTTV